MPRIRDPKVPLKEWDELTAQQQAFINAFFENGHNATQAMKTAEYYWSPSYGTNRVSAWKLRHNPHIDYNIRQRMRDNQMSEEEALARHAEQGRFNIGDYLIDEPVTCPHCEGEVLHSGLIRFDLKKAKKDGATRMIKKVGTPNRQGFVPVEFYEADKARETIMKAHGTFETKKEAAQGEMAQLMAALAKQRLSENGQDLLDE